MWRSFLIPVILAVVAGVAYFQRSLVLETWRTGSERIQAMVSTSPTPTPAAPAPEPGPTREELYYAVPIPDEAPSVAPPGRLYVLRRVKTVSETGVKALVPGELVNILERMSNNRIRVTAGPIRSDFVVPAVDLTDDTAKAREAQKKFFSRPIDGR